MFTPSSAFTTDTAASQLAAGLSAIDAGQPVFVFDQTTSFDSSAVACMLAWKRHAQQRKAEIKFEGLPANLSRMIQLYASRNFYNTALASV